MLPSSTVGIRREIRVFHYERIAMPAPARGSRLQMNARAQPWAFVSVNQLRSKGLHANNDRLGALDNLQGGFLPPGTRTGKRRTDADRPNAPARKRPVFRTSSRTIQQVVGMVPLFPGGKIG